MAEQSSQRLILYLTSFMPFGLRNSTQTFQRHTSSILNELQFVHCYIDDLLIASETPEQHTEHRRIILSRLRQYKLTINVNKCQFAQAEVLFLGFKINANGCHQPEDRVSAINNYKRPEIICELCEFFGINNYYRRCKPHDAHFQAP